MREDRIPFVTSNQIVALSCWSEAKAGRRSNGPNLLTKKNPRPKRETEAAASWIYRAAMGLKRPLVAGFGVSKVPRIQDRFLDTMWRVRKGREAQRVLVHPSLTPLHHPTAEVAVFMSAQLQSGATIAAKTRICRLDQPEGSK